MTIPEKSDIADLLYLMARLRHPEKGCPWDRKQDFSTIVPSTLEEAYEVADAITREDYAHLREELGDLLFQVVFYAELGRERGLFEFDDIVTGLIAKLIKRHPHVFPDGDLYAERVLDSSVSEQAVKHNWEEIKAQDRRQKGITGRLDDVPLALPALSRAQKLQKRAARHGFDWSGIKQVLEKIEEELGESRVAFALGEEAEIEEELGDLLFACVNAVRHAGFDAEATLRHANEKFEKRFAAMEQIADTQGKDFDELTSEQKNELWAVVKREEKSANKI